MCPTCKGWGFAGLDRYRADWGGSGNFPADATPLRNCDDCGGTGKPTKRGAK